jgi:hypothetical protein
MDITLRPMDEQSMKVVNEHLNLDTTEVIRYALSVTAYLVRESYSAGQEVLLEIRAVA